MCAMSIDAQCEAAQLLGALTHESCVLDRWLEYTVDNSWSLSTQMPAYSQLRERSAAFLTALKESLAGLDTLRVGGPELREPLQILTFTAGWMAGAGISIGTVVALCMGLRTALGHGVDGILAQLLMAATEAHAAGVEQKAQARHRMIIAKSQVVCLLAANLPALFLVGDPEQAALDDAIGRLMMVAHMRDAEYIVVEASGLREPDVVLPRVLAMLQGDPAQTPLQLLVCGLSHGLSEELLGRDGPAGWLAFEELQQALERVGREN